MQLQKKATKSHLLPFPVLNYHNSGDALDKQESHQPVCKMLIGDECVREGLMCPERSSVPRLEAKGVRVSSAGPLVPTKLGPAPSGSPAAYHQSRQLSGFTTWLVNIDPGTSRMLLVPGFQFPERDQYIFEEQHSEHVSLADDGVAPLDIPCKVSEARLRCMVGTSVYANFASAMPACALEQNTRQQSKSKTWGDARQHRLTASSFGKVLARQQWTERGLHNLLEPKDLTGVRAVQYGIKNEPLAVNRYVAVLKKLGHDVTVKHCGIFVDPSCPWLGATPDRLVFDPEEGSYGVVEVNEFSELREDTVENNHARRSPEFGSTL
ncbi:hypothetical protein HPB47_020173 [Ixodes persulcatus]|uniref:Uncharacterized protein n=1 Tax=Ixodes persulcatus TaxID=34615 RepID=A0AC60QZL2_IXOPE|nr:hypothetical protein HPB47_020173 [Ixodes persulcatus]